MHLAVDLRCVARAAADAAARAALVDEDLQVAADLALQKSRADRLLVRHQTISPALSELDRDLCAAECVGRRTLDGLVGEGADAIESRLAEPGDEFVEILGGSRPGNR